jgi:hypothetical protein
MKTKLLLFFTAAISVRASDFASLCADRAAIERVNNCANPPT